MTLVEFLTARLDEDEAVAHRALEDGWIGQQWVEIDDGPTTHAWRHDPFRVLREVEAKRRIVALWQAAEDSALRMEQMPTLYAMEEGRASLGSAMCRALAAVYADHPDYREEWKP